ncbi:MAG: glycerophosphodiester phosphodiesterase [Bradymonadales bacterium]|nr:MAG: glycerophosphodiester phosphodiesterase [Bradymonadales bacterium]
MKLAIIVLLLINAQSCTSSQVERENFRVIAHRGASAYLPENTLEATAMAHAFGPDFLECDLQLTKDNIPMVLHDRSLESTTNVSEVFPKRHRDDGRYYAIDFSWEEIQKLRVFERRRGEVLAFPGRFPEQSAPQLRVPSFAEWIELIEGMNESRGVQVGIYVEVKASPAYTNEGRDILAIVLEVLREYGYEDKTDKVFLQSFDPVDLIRAKEEFNTKIPLIQLIGMNEWPGAPADYVHMITEEGLQKVAEYAVGIGPFYRLLYDIDSKGRPQATLLSKTAKQLGLEIHPFTHRSDQLWEGFQSNDELLKFVVKTLGVHGVFTDHSDHVIQFFK